MNLSMINLQKQWQSTKDEVNNEGLNEIKYQLNKMYQKQIKPLEVNRKFFLQKFLNNGILYNEQSPYQQFYFDVQRVVPCLDFYRLHVKISHFKLIINLAKYNTCSYFTKHKNAQGCKNNVYFTSFREKQLCFKTFLFSGQKQFIKKLIKIVKQWSILKICSALECSPHIYNYLGFDIMIYNDCIQFPLQKGNQIKQLSHQQINKLKQQLRLMHQFKIIHCDVKPQNITFSSHFGKPVFIDFGFSQIIKQDLGFKTYSSFKGTPNFCCPQMLDLIMDSKGYIDLYFNDAYSLQQTARYLSKVQLVSEYFNEYKNQQYEQRRNLIDQTQFIFSAIQFHYIHKNQLHLQQFFQFYVQINEQNVRNVLRFIKDVVNYVFLPTFFYQNCLKYKKLAQYKQIEQKIKSSAELPHFKKQKKDYQVAKGQRKLNITNINWLPSSEQFIANEQITHYEQYLSIILNIQKIQHEFASHFIAMVFSCMRFDQKNIQFSDKVHIAKKINPLLIAHLTIKKQQQHNLYQIKSEFSKNVKQIKILMRLILQFCLASKPNKWIQKHFFDVFQQIIIFKEDVAQLVTSFFQYLSKNQKQFDLILVIFQLLRLQKSMQMIKIEPLQASISLNFNFRQFIKELVSRYKQIKTQDYQAKLINNSFANIMNNQKILTTDISFLNEQQELCKIKNPNIRKYFYYYLTYKKIKTYSQLGQTTQILKIIQQVKKSIDIYNIDFMSRARMIIDLMYLTYNQTALNSYYQYIASVINCEEIYQCFNTDKYIFKYNQTFCQKINVLIQTLPFLHMNISAQMLEVLLHLTPTIVSLNSRLKDKLLQLYKAYQKVQYSIKPYKQNEVQMYLDIYYKLQIQFNFFLLIPYTKSQFDKSLNQSIQQIQQLPLQTQIPQLKITFLRYKLILYKYYLSIINEDERMCCCLLQKLIVICQRLSIIFLIQELVKMLLYVSMIWKQESIMVYSAIKLYQFFKSYNQFTFYLLPVNQQYILATLHTFARHNKDYFWQMMVNLTKLLSQNPTHTTKSYFISFLNVLNQFLKQDQQFGYLIHFSRFFKDSFSNVLHENPYLLIFCTYSLYHQNKLQQQKLLKTFAVNCNLLSNFARNKLLEKYFSVFVTFNPKQNKSHRIYVFKQAKNYINKGLRKKQTKNLLRTLKKSIFHQMFKRKIYKLKNSLDYQ